VHVLGSVVSQGPIGHLSLALLVYRRASRRTLYIIDYMYCDLHADHRYIYILYTKHMIHRAEYPFIYRY